MPQQRNITQNEKKRMSLYNNQRNKEDALHRYRQEMNEYQRVSDIPQIEISTSPVQPDNDICARLNEITIARTQQRQENSRNITRCLFGPEE